MVGLTNYYLRVQVLWLWYKLWSTSNNCLEEANHILVRNMLESFSKDLSMVVTSGELLGNVSINISSLNFFWPYLCLQGSNGNLSYCKWERLESCSGYLTAPDDNFYNFIICSKSFSWKNRFAFIIKNKFHSQKNLSNTGNASFFEEGLIKIKVWEAF